MKGKQLIELLQGLEEADITVDGTELENIVTETKQRGTGKKHTANLSTVAKYSDVYDR